MTIFLARPERVGEGIRLAVKDLFDTAGLRTTYGSILFADHVPDRTAEAVARAELRRTAVAAGVRRRFAPPELRHAHAVELAREGVPLIVIQRQLGHSNLGTTSIYLQGIDNGLRESVPGSRSPRRGEDVPAGPAG